MVFNDECKILDDVEVEWVGPYIDRVKGVKKNVAPVITMKIHWKTECACKNMKFRTNREWDIDSNTYIETQVPREDYKEAPGQIQYAIEQTQEEQMMHFMSGSKASWSKMEDKVFFSYVDKNIVYDYLDMRPFEPWVMINICPAWKGQTITKEMVEDIQTMFNNYMKIDGFYDQWEYCVEGGGDGDLLHIHALCKLGGKKGVKSAKTHIQNGNHFQQLNKWSKKLKGLQGYLKGPGVQRILINNQEILDDKRKYLREKTKPEGHKNKTIKVEGSNFNGHNRWVCGKFTVK